MARTNDKNKGLEVFEKCDTGKKGYLTYDEVWSQRMMLPPELIITTPPWSGRCGRTMGLTAAGASFMPSKRRDAAIVPPSHSQKALNIEPRETPVPK